MNFRRSQSATVMQNHTVCIPKAIREEMDIHPRDIVLFTYDAGKITIQKALDWSFFAGAAKNSFKKIGGGEAFMKKERASWGRNTPNKIL